MPDELMIVDTAKNYLVFKSNQTFTKKKHTLRISKEIKKKPKAKKEKENQKQFDID